MKIVITGAAGFLGQAVVARLLALGSLPDRSGHPAAIEQIIGLDRIAGNLPADPRLEWRAGDIADLSLIAGAIDTDTDLVVHLAAIVSGQAEREFDLGMAINLDATRQLLDHIRALGHAPRFLSTSSVAVFGGDLPAIVPDDHVWLPQSSYGTQKAICDLLIADYTRRGIIDGICLRMPTISVRAGKPNAAASSFASGIIREPLAGEDAICPVDPDSILWLMSPERAVENIVHGLGLSRAQLAGRPVINMPGLSVTVREMLAALRKVAPEAAERVTVAPDPAIQAIVNSWPGNFEARQAKALGFTADADFDEIVAAYIASAGLALPSRTQAA